MGNILMGVIYLAFILVIVFCGLAAVGILVHLFMLYVFANILGIIAIFLFTQASTVFSDLYDEIVLGHGKIAKQSECIFVVGAVIVAVLSEWWFLGLGLLVMWLALLVKRALILNRGRRV